MNTCYTRVYVNVLVDCSRCCIHDFITLLLLSGNKRKQIIQVVQYLEERLRELDEEKEELKKYQQLDKQRRSLEYTLYDKELDEARHHLEEVSSHFWS